MVKIGLVGLGKMGISHYSIVNSHPDTEVVVCDASGILLDGLSKYTGAATWRDYDAMLAEAALDGVIIATPSRFHADMTRKALERGVHVFCEKPFCLDWRESEALAALAQEKGLVNQVGYHYRYVGAFQEMKRLVDAGALGRITHALAEAYGPVVLRPKGGTWRTERAAGGGCMYDYAAHPINLLNWCFGAPVHVSGTALNSIFSADTDDEVYSAFTFADGMTAQLSVNWSDESYRKMSTRISLTGENGRINADRQEIQVFLRKPDAALPDYGEGWTVRYTTELTDEVRFYLRGEEYSAQIDDFVAAIGGGPRSSNDFAAAAQTDRTMGLMLADHGQEKETLTPLVQDRPAPRRRGLFGLSLAR